jgi:chromate reductase, NAD(P)H dehydrogenase (quinone)
MTNVTIFSASNNNNLKLATSISEEVSKQNGQPSIINIVDLDLPLYTPDAQNKGIPSEITTLVDSLKNVAHFAFITPEYNGGIAPSLTNLIAWISVSSEDWRDCFNGKKAIIGTHSGGGGLHALMQLRTQLAYLSLNVIGRQLHTHYQKALDPKSLNAVVTELLK